MVIQAVYVIKRRVHKYGVNLGNCFQKTLINILIYITNETNIVSICIMYHLEDIYRIDSVIYFCRLQNRINGILH